MQNTDFRTILRVAAMLASVAWCCLSVYYQFLKIDPNQFGFRAPEIEQRMKACSGSFAQRYKCKEELIIDKGHESFVVWMGKVALVLGPPLVLFSVVGFVTKRRAEEEYDNYAPPPPSISKRRMR